MGYEWDSGALEWIARYGLEPGEVLQVLYARKWPRVAVTPEGLLVLTLWGRPMPGHPFDAWIVNARLLNDAELTELAQWEESQS